MTSNPTKPWYIIHHDDLEKSVRVTQNKAATEEPNVRVDVVPPEWPSPDHCANGKLHNPHSWGGVENSPFRCTGQKIGT